MHLKNSKQNRTSLNRIYHTVKQGWFVESREGKLGPYLNYLEANRALRMYVQDAINQRHRQLTAANSRRSTRYTDNVHSINAV